MSTGHAKLSPSSAERWFACAGSLNLIATLPPAAFKTSKYAAEGTVAHQLAEDFVTNRVDLLTLTSRVGEIVIQEGFEIEITDAMVEGVIEYVDHIAAIKRSMPKKPSGVQGFAEVRAIAESVDAEVYGTADYLLFQKGDALHVFDFKYGKGVVEAEENKQGLTYLVGAQDRWVSATNEGAAGRAFDKIFFHIVQPRARHDDGVLRTWELPKGRLDAFRVELKEAVERTRNPHAARVAGTWCKFCPALAYCPEARGAIEGTVQTTFTKLPMPPSKEVGQMSLPDVSKLTPEQVSKALDWEDTIDSWFEALRARALADMLCDPEATPGYKLVEGKSNRIWGNEEAAETAFAMLGEERYNRKLKSPAQMEKIAGKEEVAKYTVKPAGKLTVAKSSDKREAVRSVGQAADVFGRIASSVVLSQEAKDEFAVFGSVVTDKKGNVVKGMLAEASDHLALFGDLAGDSAAPKKKETIWP